LNTTSTSPACAEAPGIKRRLSVMLYEGLLLFGVLMIAGLLFAITFQQRSSLYMRHAFQYWLFFIIGVYFIWFWMHGGQTLPMKTWRMRVVTVQGSALSWRHALARYVLAWLWVLPGLTIAWALGTKGWTSVFIVFANVLAWILTACIHPSRQFLHDRIAGTKIINVEKPAV
jgi:uncharacterized RDD family membrane protein YckC